MFLKIEEAGGAHLYEAAEIFYSKPLPYSAVEAAVHITDPNSGGTDTQYRVFRLEPQGLSISTDQRAYVLNDAGKTIDVVTPWDRPR